MRRPARTYRSAQTDTARFALVWVLFAATACGGGPQRQADTPPTDSGAPAGEVATRPDTQPTPPQPIVIATDLRSYRAGDPVQLRITNTTAAQYTFNPCTRVIEQRGDSAQSWTPVKEERICTMIAHVLEPNSARSERTELAEELRPGTYRLVIQFAVDSPAATTKRVAAQSPPVTVTP